jgi:hypothetical protein
MATKTCTTITPVVGPASRSRLGPMGAVTRGWDKTSSEDENTRFRAGRKERPGVLSLAHAPNVPGKARRHKGRRRFRRLKTGSARKRQETGKNGEKRQVNGGETVAKRSAILTH